LCMVVYAGVTKSFRVRGKGRDELFDGLVTGIWAELLQSSLLRSLKDAEKVRLDKQ